MGRMAIESTKASHNTLQLIASPRTTAKSRTLHVVIGEDDNNDDEPNESSLLHGTQVLKSVVSPWFGSNRIVCTDSNFASVGAAKELYRNDICFIGVVKTATKGFPITYLTSVKLNQCGDFLALSWDPVDELDPAMAAFAWMDHERRYFIATAGSLLEGSPYTRCRWQQVSQDPNTPPEKITMTIKKPQIAKVYYTTDIVKMISELRSRSK